jgi:NTE family protein
MLEVFDELGVKPAVIAGTSMGAICGAAYAAGLSGAELRREFLTIFSSRRRFFKDVAAKLPGNFSSLWSIRNPWVVDNVTLFEVLLPEVMRRSFADLRIPLLAVAADFYGIEQVVLDSGPLIPALAASAALPSLSRPVVIDGRVLIDGGYVNPVPYDVIMDRCDLTVAVDVTGDPKRRPGRQVPRTLDLVTGATLLLFHSVTREKRRRAEPDIFVRPDVGAYASFDYFRAQDIFATAEPAKEDLKRKLSQMLDALS